MMGAFLVWAFRLISGTLFIFSGFTKGVDPFGSLYKFREYLSALDVWMPDTVILTGVIVLCVFEFLLGLMLLLGCFRRSAVLLSLALMACMLIVTFWTAVADPVEDCGCFGDALLISNNATFVKNLLITAGLVFLLKFNTTQPCLITPYLQWLAVVGGGIYLLFISLYGYNVQPLVDFRPFKAGAALALGEEADTVASDASGLRFVYRRGNETLEVGTEDTLPDESEGWEFVERREAPQSPGSSRSGFQSPVIAPEPFAEGDDSHLPEAGEPTLLVLVPELDRLSKTQAWKIESLWREAQAEGYTPVMIASGSGGAFEVWTDTLGGVPFYEEEDTVLKMIARGNPAVVMLKDGKVEWKSTLKSLPADSQGKWLADYSRNDSRRLAGASLALAAWLLALILAYRMPGIFSYVFMRRPSTLR